MNTNIKFAIFISLVAHIAIISGLVWLNSISPEMAFGDREYIVAVELMQPEASSQKLVASKQKAETESQMREAGNKRQEARDEKPTLVRPELVEGQVVHPSTGLRMNDNNATGNLGTNKILAKIKAKIERAKQYPRLARKMKIEGRPTVLFEINPDGSLKFVKITTSSGQEMIDSAALDTVKRAAPLPYYDKPIRLAIRYELK